MTPLLDQTALDRSTDLPRRGSVMLLGSFDGFHLGHQALLARAMTVTAVGGVSVLQCAPHPRAFFGRDAGFRIATGHAQRLCLHNAGLKQICAPRFDSRFASLSPKAFAQDYLRGRYDVCAVVVGENFRFGHDRVGTVHTLKDLGQAFGFAVEVESLRPQDGTPITSSRIRGHLRQGQIAEGVALLGHPWLIAARVHVDHISFDPDQLLPPLGRYRMRISDAQGQDLGAVFISVQGRTAVALGGPNLAPGPVLMSLDGDQYCKED